VDQKTIEYLDGKFASFDTRVVLLERESSHVRRNMLSEDRAQAIFRTEVLKVNTRTRIAVAIIAAIALIGNGAQNAMANHDSMALQLRCEKGTSEALERDRSQTLAERHAIADEAARRAVLLRDQQIDTLKGPP
jgi:hypothetical protein